MQTRVNVKHIKSKTFIESESYKKLRTNIQFSGKNIKAIAFTSALPGEGKSELSYRIAFSLANMGKKTIFVDSDLRNSNIISRVIKDYQGDLKGLVHCLVGENTLDEVIVGTQNPNFDIITIGAYPPNPSELLSQEAYKEIIEELKQKYDYVIIDTPPAGFVVDGVIASAAADGVIFIVSSGMVSYKNARLVIDELNLAGCKMIGAALNKCTKKTESHYGYGYTSSYNSIYGYGTGYTAGFNRSKSTSKRLKRIFEDKIKK